MPEEHASTIPIHYYYLAAGVGVLLIGGIVWYALSRTHTIDTSAIEQQATDALLNTQATATSSIPATSNPVKDATPAVNPVRAANPFDVGGGSSGSAASTKGTNGYQNPFE